MPVTVEIVGQTFLSVLFQPNKKDRQECLSYFLASKMRLKGVSVARRN
jgi:hypothetical protein